MLVSPATISDCRALEPTGSRPIDGTSGSARGSSVCVTDVPGGWRLGGLRMPLPCEYTPEFTRL
eukprot:2517653-Prorocentrum_lima.AAC.1